MLKDEINYINEINYIKYRKHYWNTYDEHVNNEICNRDCISNECD